MKKPLAIVLAAAILAPAAGAIAAKKQPNRAVIDRYFEIVDGKQLDKLPDIETADVVVKTPMASLSGPAGHAQLLKGFAAAFPNYKHVDNRCVEAGDLISCEGKFVGDHTGPMMTPDGKTIPATQKHVDLGYAGFARVKNGKIAELHVYFDTMAFMQQLGLVPSPPKTASK
jgi:predicted ester cyclase